MQRSAVFSFPYSRKSYVGTERLDFCNSQRDLCSPTLPVGKANSTYRKFCDFKLKAKIWNISTKIMIQFRTPFSAWKVLTTLNLSHIQSSPKHYSKHITPLQWWMLRYMSGAHVSARFPTGMQRLEVKPAGASQCDGPSSYMWLLYKYPHTHAS